MIGMVAVFVGSIMALYEGYYSSSWWKSRPPQRPMSVEASKRLAKFQGLVLLLMGLVFLYVSLFR
jgi:uncharacterized iron-regulated membrane protein